MRAKPKPESLEVGIGRELLDFARFYESHEFLFNNKLYAGSELKFRSKRVLSLVCKRIEGVELPVGSTGSIQEACRRAILREVRK